MASLGPSANRRFYPQTGSSPSTTSLLPQPLSRSSSNGTAVQATFARGPPSLRSMASMSSLVSRSSAELAPPLACLSSFAVFCQNESPYNVSAAPGSRIPINIPSISDKASLSLHVLPTVLWCISPCAKPVANTPRSFLFPLTPPRGALIWTPVARRPMITFITLILSETDRTILGAMFSPTEASLI